MTPPVAVLLKLDQRKLPAEIFEQVTARAGLRRDRDRRADAAWNAFGKPGRDPASFGGVMGAIITREDWTPHLKVAQLRTHWDQVVGPAVAAHSHVADFRDGVLTIHADSPVWATQLTYLIPQLTDTVRERLDGLDIDRIRVTGPGPQGGVGGRFVRRRR